MNGIEPARTGGVHLPYCNKLVQHGLTAPSSGMSMAGPSRDIGIADIQAVLQQRQLEPGILQSQLARAPSAAQPQALLQQGWQPMQQTGQQQQQVKLLVVTEQQLQALQNYQQQQQQQLYPHGGGAAHTVDMGNNQQMSVTVNSSGPCALSGALQRQQQPSQHNADVAVAATQQQQQEQCQPRLLQDLIRQQLQAATRGAVHCYVQPVQHTSNALLPGGRAQLQQAITAPSVQVKAEYTAEANQAVPGDGFLHATDAALQQHQQDVQMQQRSSAHAFERHSKRGSEDEGDAPAKRTCVRSDGLQHTNGSSGGTRSPPGTPCSSVKQPAICPGSTAMVQQHVAHVVDKELVCVQDNAAAANMLLHSHPTSHTHQDAAEQMSAAMMMSNGTMVTVSEGHKVLLAAAQGAAAAGLQGGIIRAAPGSGTASWDTSHGSAHSVLTTDQQEQLLQLAGMQQHKRPASDGHTQMHTSRSHAGQEQQHIQQDVQVQAQSLHHHQQQQQQAHQPSVLAVGNGTQQAGQAMQQQQGGQLISVMHNGHQRLMLLPAGMQLSMVNGAVQVVPANQQVTGTQPVLQQQQAMMQPVHVQGTGNGYVPRSCYAVQSVQGMQVVHAAAPAAQCTQQHFQVAPQMSLPALSTGMQGYGMVMPGSMVHGMVRAAAGEVAMPYMQRVATRAQVESAMAEVVEVMRHKPRGRPVKYIDLGVNRMALKYHVGVRLAGRVESMGATDTELAAHMLMDMVKIGLGLYVVAASAIPPSVTTHPEEQMTNQLAQHPSCYSTAFVQRVIAQLVNRNLIASSELGAAYVRAQAAGCMPGPCFASVSAALSAFS